MYFGIINILNIIPFVVIYSALYLSLLPIFIIRTLIKDKGSLKNKLGFGYKKHTNAIHFHCVSVGEFNASIPLIDKFLPHYSVVITTTTQTGRNACVKHYGDAVTHYYFPFDIIYSVKKFLNNINPIISIILETEIWANFLTQAKKHNIKTYLVNARLSKKSLQKYQKFAKFSLQTMHMFDKILTQDKVSDDNFKALGVQNSYISGNLKFDIQTTLNPDRLSTIKHIINNRAYVVCSSTHAPEEQLIIQSLKKHNNNDLIVIIPRHPQRFKEVENILIQQNINYIKQSDAISCTPDTQVVLADAMGFVLEYYSLCKLAFIGGSLSGTGGHNMLEAIIFDKLCVFGPDTFNFKYVVDNLLQQNAGVQIQNIDEIWDIANAIHSNKYQTIVRNASLFMQQNTGVSEKIFTMVKPTH
jgi:3-deoxy-D-manno-octulosonic-acid transferase